MGDSADKCALSEPQSEPDQAAFPSESHAEVQSALHDRVKYLEDTLGDSADAHVRWERMPSKLD